MIDISVGKNDLPAAFDSAKFQRLASFFFDQYCADKSRLGLHLKALTTVSRYAGDSMLATVSSVEFLYLT